jgi:hypothetical protein
MAHKHSTLWERVFNNDLPSTSLLMLARTPPGASLGIPEQERVSRLNERITACPPGEIAAFQVVVEDVLTYLFCENFPNGLSLRKPLAQAKTDMAYESRDLVFENRATSGFWSEARTEFGAAGVIADAKNYSNEIDGDVVRDFASKYLKDFGLGRLGLLVARKVPPVARSTVPFGARVPSAIEEQKEQWRTHHRMVILLDDTDLAEMLSMKRSGADPTELLRARIFTLKARI